MFLLEALLCHRDFFKKFAFPKTDCQPNSILELIEEASHSLSPQTNHTPMYKVFNQQANPKAYLICPTNSLTFPKTEDCSAKEQNFASFTG